jgi:acyl-CoA synthetase (AMP-forming)/AMP-acid ligase II
VKPVSDRVSNIAHFLTRNARRIGAEPAVIVGEAVTDWAMLDARVSALAWVLREEFGVGFGDRVLVQAVNSRACVEVMLACFRLGAVWCPCNWRLTPGEVAGQARVAGARLLVCDAAFADHREAVGGAVLSTAWEERIAPWMGRAMGNADVGRYDACWLFFTSGSTGRPKGVVLTQGQLTFTILNHLNDLMPGLSHRDRSLVVAPLSHGAGMHFLAQLAAGAGSVILEGAFDPGAVWAAVERHGIGNMFTVPTIVKRLLEHEGARRGTALRHVIYAGAPMYAEDQRRALEVLGPVLVQYYGLGEVTGAITVLRAEDHVPARAGSCGVERTGMELRIMDEAGHALPPGETGEVCVTGPAVCAGYWENEAANREAFRDGWFRTGDMGHMDGEGYLYLTGRRSDMFITGGSNVHPREVEEVLLTHPDVAEVAVIGVPDRDLGEVGWAVVVARGEVVEAELARWLEGRVARYKVPRRFVLVSEIPKSGYGKVTRALVRGLLERMGIWPG